MTTIEMRDGKTPSSQRRVKPDQTPEQMIEALKKMGYAVELPSFPLFLEQLAKELVEIVQTSELQSDQIWRSVAAKLNENNWKAVEKRVESFERRVSSASPINRAPHVSSPPIPAGRMDGEVIVAPPSNMLNLEMDPSRL